ncbi:hypothetical protein U9M48_041482 [Paspalum notatum var. saurae]|uniref:F-box domain-containing protein n=1 Tax=Paspalum notatum var. saurae TaxID=547442 RepID=A0AAQ3XE83_PASNO
MTKSELSSPSLLTGGGDSQPPAGAASVPSIPTLSGRDLDAIPPSLPPGPGANMDGPNVAAGLPDDPLVEILSRVPAKSLCRFKCVSKAWRGLINDPLHRKKLPHAMEGLFFWPKRLGGSDSDVDHLSFIHLTARSVPLDIDSCFSSVLTGLPEAEILELVDSCNGLMLLKHRRWWDPDFTSGYIVFNPTTRQRRTVPSCGCPKSLFEHTNTTYLAFDPAISSQFHLIHMRERSWSRGEGQVVVSAVSVHAYSSEIGTWSHNQTTWDELANQGWETYGMGMSNFRAFVNGMLHLFVSNVDSGEHQMLAVDVQGMIQRMISLPVPTNVSSTHQRYVIHSQGLLHYVISDLDAKSGQLHLHVWVLQKYDAKGWVRKDTVCIPKLVGKWDSLDQLVDMHQDCNVFFFLQNWNRELMAFDKLIAYDMDSKEVSVLVAPGNKGFYSIGAPYVPCFADLPVLTN